MDKKNNILTIKDIVSSMKHIQSLNMEMKTALCDKIKKEQPVLLGGVLVLNNMKIPIEKVDIVLHVLLILYHSFSKKFQLKPVTEEMYELETRKFTSMINYLSGESISDMQLINEQAINFHPEKNAFAFIFGYMKDHGLLNTDFHSQECMRALMVVFNCIIWAKIGR